GRDARVGVALGRRGGQDKAYGAQDRLPRQKPPRSPIDPTSHGRGDRRPQSGRQSLEEPSLVLLDRTEIDGGRSTVQRRQHLDIHGSGIQAQQRVYPSRAIEVVAARLLKGGKVLTGG